MKKIFISVTVILLGVFLISGYNNAFAKSKKEAAAEAAAQQKKALEEERKRAAEEEKRKALEESSRKALKAKEWTIYVSPEDGLGKTETEVIVFTEEGKVIAKGLLEKGYGESNFRLTAQNGSAVWETMKVDKDKNFAFLRGELRDEQMNGSIFYKFANGKNVTYLYTTNPPAAPADEEQGEKKKKKGKKG